MAEGEKVTISVIKADTGSLVGNHIVPPIFEETAEDILEDSVDEIILDYHVTHVGDDMSLILLHNKGEDNPEVHGLAWKIFQKTTKIAKDMGLYGAGEDLLSEDFKGNIKNMGPGVAEMTINVRQTEPIFVFAADKTEAGAFNYPLFQMFANPFNTPGLIIDPAMHMGFKFEIWDLDNHKKIYLSAPEDLYDILSLIGSIKYVIKRIYPRQGHKIPENEPVAVTSTERLNAEAGKYVGKDDPVMIVRSQKGLPAAGEVLEAFSFPYMVDGWMRGFHWGPLMPVSVKDAKATRFDGPARVISLGFQVKNGKLYGPEDMFDDPAFDLTRNKAMEITDYIRRHGPFEPHRVSSELAQYTTLPKILEKLKDRFQDI